MSKFGNWVTTFGVGNVPTGLRSINPRAGCTIRQVRNWLNGSSEPQRERVRAIVKLAAGELTAADVLDHFDMARNNPRAKTRIA